MLASLRRAAELDPRFESALKAALAQGAAGLFGGSSTAPSSRARCRGSAARPSSACC
ncbi:MAG: hypothetical protein M0D55_10355 [Elusimicrobiota bacterium]|nr:MAG: hypothetical protein M0D55_10355 [Elusimicrobiota bacterium]